MSLWPFVPLSGAVEVLEWKTNVLRARAGEQRQRLRERPRRQWHFTHLFDADGQSAARAIARSASAFEIPDWALPIYSGAVAAGSSVSIAVDTSGLGLVAGKQVCVISSLTDYEVCTIASVSPSALVLSFVSAARSAAKIYRVDSAHAAVELGFDRPAGPLQRASIIFEAAAVDCYASTAYAQYRGHDVLPLVPVVGAGRLDESLAWPRDVFDNGTGLPTTAKKRDLSDEKFTMRWHAFAASDIAAVRSWIASRYGRWLAFWFSSWQRDFVAAADLGASATVLRVFTPSGAITLGKSDFDLEIQAPSTAYCRRVTSVSAGPLVAGSKTLDLTLDSALGTAVSAAAFGRISYLRCVRFDADRIEILHAAGEGIAVAVPCIEVPVP